MLLYIHHIILQGAPPRRRRVLLLLFQSMEAKITSFGSKAFQLRILLLVMESSLRLVQHLLIQPWILSWKLSTAPFQPAGMILMHLNTPGSLKIMYIVLPPLQLPPR